MGTELAVENRAGLAAEAFGQLFGVLVGHDSVKRVVDWLAGHTPPFAPVDVLAQDEYSHDVLVAYPGGLWIVYDST